MLQPMPTICRALAVVVLLAAAPVSNSAPPPPTAPPTLDPTYGLAIPKKVSRAAAKADSAWIWAKNTRDEQTALLRGSFSLSALPGSAVVYVTADDFFTLYINGQKVDESAPDPKDGNVWQHVHKRSVAAVLRSGRNVVALRARNAGGAAGAILRLEVDGKPVLLTDDRWKASDEAEPPDWTSVDFNDAAWQSARVVGPLTSDPWASVGGLLDWPGYDTSASYLAHITLQPVAVSDVSGPVEGLRDIASQGAKPIRILKASDSTVPGFVLDFGKEVAGRIEIEGDGGAALVGTGESREEAMKAPRGGTHSLELTTGHMTATPWSAFRYAKVAFPALSAAGADRGPVFIRSISVNHKYYPVNYKGRFDCSDPLLTRIWYTGAYTAHLCMQEDIWDAPKRDRARWMGDQHVAGAVINIAFADKFLMEQTMDRLRAETQTADERLPHSHVNGIPGYSCAWICGLADFHRHIGDMVYLKRQHDHIVSTIEYFHGELDARGLFANNRKAWPFVDWAPDFNADGPLARQATHFFIIKAAKEAVFLLRELGDDANAAKCKDFANDLSGAAQKYYKRADGFTFSDRRQDNSMAIYSGLTTPEQSREIYDRILAPGNSSWSRVATPYYNNYVIYAMSLAGHNMDTLDFIRRYWGGMLAEGATSWWEGYDPSWEKSDFHAHLQADNGTGYFVSLAHGWSAGPTSWLTERVLGVRPTSGGFKTAEIVPDLGGLAWAEGDIPAPEGTIHVRAEAKGRDTTVEVTIPKGVDALVGLPGDQLTQNGKRLQSVHMEAGRQWLHLDHPGRVVLKCSVFEKAKR